MRKWSQAEQRRDGASSGEMVVTSREKSGSQAGRGEVRLAAEPVTRGAVVGMGRGTRHPAPRAA